MNYYLSLMQSVYSVEFIREGRDGHRQTFLKNFSSKEKAEKYAATICRYSNVIKTNMLLDGKYWYSVNA